MSSWPFPGKCVTQRTLTDSTSIHTITGASEGPFHPHADWIFTKPGTYTMEMRAVDHQGNAVTEWSPAPTSPKQSTTKEPCWELHLPVFNPQTRHASELTLVCRNEDQIVGPRLGRNPQIVRGQRPELPNNRRI